MIPHSQVKLWAVQVPAIEKAIRPLFADRVTYSFWYTRVVDWFHWIHYLRRTNLYHCHWLLVQIDMIQLYAPSLHPYCYFARHWHWLADCTSDICTIMLAASLKSSSTILKVISLPPTSNTLICRFIFKAKSYNKWDYSMEVLYS